MITVMSKYVFLIYHREYKAFLESLRNLEVVHIQENKNYKDVANLQELLTLRKDVENSKRMLKMLRAEDAPAEQIVSMSKDEAVAAYQSVIDLFEQSKKIQSAITAKRREVEQMSVWGQFEPAMIDKLHQTGYDVNFYSTAQSSYMSEWEEKYGAIPINNFRSTVYFVTVAKPSSERPMAERVKLSPYSLNTLQGQLDELQANLEKNKAEISDFANNRIGELSAYDRILNDEFNFGNAMLQGDAHAEDKLMVLEGWIPREKEAELETALKQEGQFFEKLEISDEDRVPIKLKNNSFAKLFEPITSMFSLPNYNEIDQTALFAPFFMLFFGLCFGDGGYGLLILIACTVLKFKAKPALKPLLSLFQWLGGAAAVLGLMMGSFFGINLVEVPMFAPIKDYFLGSDKMWIGNYPNLMVVSVVIGLAQIVYGKITAAIKIKMQRGTKYSIAPFAWVFAIVALLAVMALSIIFGSDGKSTLNPIVTNVLYGIAGLSLLVALFYNSPGKNPFINLGSGLWSAYNVASGLLGDTLSYIRLFAIGLTGSILGGVFNSLATQTTADLPIVPRFIVMLLILIFGHSLNFGLTMISSLVHPLRLTFVEFYKNSEFEGGGKQYSPFSKSK